MSNEISALAQEVLGIAKAQLLVKLRFLDRALYELKPMEQPLIPLATDGFHLLYEPLSLLKGYRQQQSFVLRGYLHALLHCLFRHMFVSLGVDHDRWDLACDMAVQAMMDELKLPQLAEDEDQRRKSVVEQLRGKVRPLTAEKIYRWLEDEKIAPAMMDMWRKLFRVDDHGVWYIPVAVLEEGGGGEGSGDGSSGSSGKGGSDEGSGTGSSASGDVQSRQAQAQMWQDVSQRMQTDLETFSKSRGDQAGTLVQALRVVNREKVDYSAFLRKFAVQCEVMKLSPDEFDYIFYTYGMTMYRDMPLIEPLEYRDDKRIHDFVIAIDTSGSVKGEIVQRFLQKTYNILKQEETFDARFNLHIIQCDAQVQEDAVIHTQEEMEEYIRRMTLRGFGGTDFRPVFEYVEKLRREKAFRDLRGLLYFTDGYGVYPAKPTEYRTAFVFLAEDLYDTSAVPPWAIRVVLEEDGITELDPPR